MRRVITSLGTGGPSHGYKPLKLEFNMPPNCRALPTHRYYQRHSEANPKEAEIAILTDELGQPVVHRQRRKYLRPGEVAYILR